MTFAEQLKTLRKQTGFSQEKLAEKLGVSRQAVTKWETGAGTPELENLTAISTLFGVSLDELVSGEKQAERPADFLFESVTEYDVDEPKRMDVKLGGAKLVSLSSHDGEKLRVRLASNTMPGLQSDFKVKLDDIRNRLDVDVTRRNGVTEAAAKEALYISILLPRKYAGKVELSASAETVELADLSCDGVELDVKARSLTLDGVRCTAEVNCDLDMEIVCRSLDGAVELNQRSATSRIAVPRGAAFSTRVRGLGNSVSYQRGGKPCEDFSTPGAEAVVELNGMKSELLITEAVQ